MTTDTILERLEKHPKILSCVKKMLDIADNSLGDIDLADDAEERVIHEGRELNKEVLSTWATQQCEKKSKQFRKRHLNMRQSGKKK